MPPDFAPVFCAEGDRIVWRGTEGALSFLKREDSPSMREALRQSIWQWLELNH